MIIYNLNVKSMAMLPYETNPPLIIDSYTILSLSFALQSLKAVCRWYAQILKRNGSMKHPKFSVSDILYISRQFSRTIPGKYLLGFFALEGAYHNLIV